MKILKIISRLLTGCVFIFSGFVKAVDPLGTVYKISDYLVAFNMDFFIPAALFFAILLCSAEFLCGVSVLFNIKPVWGIWGVLLLMIFFTPLTLILALTNPVSDCGCFGDAIKLTNWQTFFKNLILLIPAIYLFVNRKTDKKTLSNKKENIIIVSITAVLCLFIRYNLRYLPVIDFRPYKIGNHIPDQMTVPEGMPTDQYSTIFIYEKNGQQKEFSIDNYPADDTTWKFIDSRNTLISKGYEPPIHDLFFTDDNGIDITEEILSHQGYTMFMISKKIAEVDDKKLEEGFKLGDYCKNNGIAFYFLTASNKEEIEQYNIKSRLTDAQTGDDCIFSIDEITLKTMIRSNPGYMLIKDGTVINKWSWARIPDQKYINNIINNKL